MSNPLSARRVMFQNLKEDGSPNGEPTYGVIVSDSYESGFNNTFQSVAELNAAIEKDGCIARLVEEFAGEVSPNKVGTNNFYGKNWSKYDKEDEKMQGGEGGGE